MSVKIKPIAGTQNRIVVEPLPAETKTASGIIIPDNAKEKPQKGKVIAVSTDLKDEQATVKEGDIVIYGKYSGTEFSIDSVNYLIMRESDIFGILS